MRETQGEDSPIALQAAVDKVSVRRKIRKINFVGCSARRTERRNRNVHEVHEDFEYRATQQCAH
jgi:hypothetical protein